MYYVIFGVLFLCATVALAVLTYYAFNDNDSTAKKIGFTIGAVACLLISLTLLTKAVNNRADNRVYPIEEDDGLSREEKMMMADAKSETLKITLRKLYEAMKMKNQEREMYSDYDDYFIEKYREILMGNNISDYDKKKIAMDFFRASEYFDGNGEATDNGVRLVELKKPEARDYDRGLLQYMGTDFERLRGYGKLATYKELPSDIYFFQREIKGLNTEIDRGPNKINIPDPGTFGLSPLDYFIDKKRRENQERFDSYR